MLKVHVVLTAIHGIVVKMLIFSPMIPKRLDNISRPRGCTYMVACNCNCTNMQGVKINQAHACIIIWSRTLYGCNTTSNSPFISVQYCPNCSPICTWIMVTTHTVTLPTIIISNFFFKFHVVYYSDTMQFNTYRPIYINDIITCVVITISLW